MSSEIWRPLVGNRGFLPLVRLILTKQEQLLASHCSWYLSEAHLAKSNEEGGSPGWPAVPT